MADIDTKANQDYVASHSDTRLMEAAKRAERIIAEAEVQARKRGQEIVAETVEDLRAQIIDEVNRKALADARKIVAEAEEKARIELQNNQYLKRIEEQSTKGKEAIASVAVEVAKELKQIASEMAERSRIAGEDMGRSMRERKELEKNDRSFSKEFAG